MQKRYFRGTSGTIKGAPSKYSNHPTLHELCRVYLEPAQMLWPARLSSQWCWGCTEGPSTFPVPPFKSNSRGAKGSLCKPSQSFRRGSVGGQGRYHCQSIRERRACSGETRKALADEPVPIPFSAKSLRISMMKQFKTSFNYLSSTSITQFSQGTVIQPIFLPHNLLPKSPESFSFILPSISSPLSLLFLQEWKFPEDCNYARPLKATFPGVQGSTASPQVQHRRILSSINGSSDW